MATKQATKTKSKKVIKKARTMPTWLRIITAPFRGAGRYVGGAWRELREVRWPNRRATWGLTLAVLLFSASLTLFVILLDLGLDWLSKKVLL